MSQCEYIQGCLFFNNSEVHKMTKLVQDLKTAYCFGENTQCARYSILLALGRSAVPELMLPNQHAWAKQVLADTKKLH